MQFRLVFPLMGACALLALVGCGFEPVYAKRDTPPEAGRADSRTALESVKVVTEAGRNGQIVQIALEDILYAGKKDNNTKVEYKLSIATHLLEYPAVIQNTQFVSRTNIRIQLIGTLTDAKTDKIIWSGSVVRLASFNLSQTADYASFVARDDALKRGLEAASQDMAMNVQARLGKPKDAKFTGAETPPTPMTGGAVDPTNPNSTVMPGGINTLIPGTIDNGNYSSGISR